MRSNSLNLLLHCKVKRAGTPVLTSRRATGFDAAVAANTSKCAQQAVSLCGAEAFDADLGGWDSDTDDEVGGGVSEAGGSAHVDGCT
jgi:hypothetical protein